MSHPPGRIVSGILLIVAGVVVELVVFGIIPIDEKNVHAPQSILALLGLLCLGAGLAIVVNPKSSLATWSAGTVVITITIVSAWVSLFGASEHFSGDWPFLSDETNVMIARVMFGCVSLLGLAMIVAAVKKTWGGDDG